MSEAEEQPPGQPQGAICLDLSASNSADAALLSPLERHVCSAIFVLGTQSPMSGEVRIRLVRDEEMAALHERHSGILGTTDVLTFDLREDPSDAASPLDVDLVLCVDEAGRQAASRSIPIEHELTLYAIHGILHVLGHDDHDDDASRMMHAREDQILSAAGLGAVFSAPETRESAL